MYPAPRAIVRVPSEATNRARNPCASLAAIRVGGYACPPMLPTMLTLTSTSDSAVVSSFTAPRTTSERSPFVFIGERLWLDFVNCEHGMRHYDALRDFESMVR